MYGNSHILLLTTAKSNDSAKLLHCGSRPSHGKTVVSLSHQCSVFNQGPCHGKGLATLHLMSYSIHNKLVLLSVNHDLQQHVRSTAQQQNVLSCCNECIRAST